MAGSWGTGAGTERPPEPGHSARVREDAYSGPMNPAVGIGLSCEPKENVTQADTLDRAHLGQEAGNP